MPQTGRRGAEDGEEVKCIVDEEEEEERTTDSGFLSGGNLIISGEITAATGEDATAAEVEEGKHQRHPRRPPDAKVVDDDDDDDTQMRLDSGVHLGLADSLATLSLNKPELNDLSNVGCKTKTNNDLITKEFPIEHLTWQVYFQQDEDGDTPLHLAIVHGFVNWVFIMIRKAPHPRFLDTSNMYAQTPLHLAVATGQPNVVRWLVLAGAQRSPRNAIGDSPMHIAARTGDIQSCKAIADPIRSQERDVFPTTTYQSALTSSATPALDQWNYEGQTCVHLAAMNGHVDMLRHLVHYGADINAREGCSGYTALHYAIQRGDLLMIDYLLNECRTLKADQVTYGGNSVLQLGYNVPSNVWQALVDRGVETAQYDSEDESDSEDDDDISYDGNSKLFAAVPNLVNASA